MTYAPEKREHLYKILVIGELGKFYCCYLM